MTPEQKEWIDKATYIELLEKWRFGDCKDTIFQGEAGAYLNQMRARRLGEVGQEAAVQASKAIGWRL